VSASLSPKVPTVTDFLWPTLEALKALGGTATNQQIDAKVIADLRLTPDQLRVLEGTGPQTQVAKRLAWARTFLGKVGAVSSKARGVWAISETGSALRKENIREVPSQVRAAYVSGRRAAVARSQGVDTQKEIVSPAKPRSHIISGPTDSPMAHANQPVPPTTHPAFVHSTGTESQQTDPDDADGLCARLTRSQRQSDESRQFEQDIAAAFEYLGFESRHIGGSREADVVLTAHLGAARYVVVIDAKSSQSGTIRDRVVHLPAIAGYKRNHGADYAAVVGESFESGQLHEFAALDQVKLLTTPTLIETIRFHSKTPLGLDELRALFDPTLSDRETLRKLQTSHFRSLRYWRLLAQVLETLHQQQMSGEPAFTVEYLYGTLRTLYGKSASGDASRQSPLTPEEVADVVAFLRSHTVDILTQISSSPGHLQLGMSPTSARRRLRALASAMATV
jgi:hypothetical protein